MRTCAPSPTRQPPLEAAEARRSGGIALRPPTFAAAAGRHGRVRARLTRRGIVYARGHGTIRPHHRSIGLTTVRPTHPGRYTLSMRYGSGLLVRQPVVVR
jgi:hypothetical protein